MAILYLHYSPKWEHSIPDNEAQYSIAKAVSIANNGVANTLNFNNEAILNWGRVARKQGVIARVIIQTPRKDIEVDKDGRIEGADWLILETCGLCQTNEALRQLL